MDTDCSQYEKYFRTETTTFPTITVILRGFSTVITSTDLLAAASSPTATISDVQGSGTSVYAPESYPTWTSEVSNGMSPWKIGTIVGGILAGLLTVALLGFSAFLVARRRKRKAAVRRLEVSPGKEDDAVTGVAELSTSAALSPPPIIPELDTSTAVMELNLPPNIRELGPFPRETKHELHG